MERSVPQYVHCSVPVPRASRVPWYKSTFPAYGGIFLWVGFYLKLAEPTIGSASLSVCLWGLLLAGLLCFGLYYYVPATDDRVHPLLPRGPDPPRAGEENACPGEMPPTLAPAQKTQSHSLV